MSTLFDPLQVGALEAPNRIVMAPLTRNRAGEHQAPTALNAEYYAQRASAAFIVAEGTQPSATGQGYLDTPGIHTPEQVAGWRLVADAVHAADGRIVVQLMHAGRIAHPDNTGGLTPVAPSAIAAPDTIVTPTGKQPSPTPRALDTDEVPGIVEEFVHAARCAREAGLDGVEIHAANGYLLHQFLAPSSNERDDQYGGSPENRARLVIDVVRAVSEAIGADRVGLRISPAHNVQGALEPDADETRATYTALIDAIAPLRLAYLSILADPRAELTTELRRRFDGVVALNSGFASHTSLEEASAIVAEGLADLVAVGRPFLANPDLPARWAAGAELNKPDPSTFYAGDARGYTDYPAMR